MALITRNEVKTLLQITGTSQDDLIDAMIIFMRDWVTDYCNNKFLNQNFYYSASTISMFSKTIADSESGFVTAGFVPGLDIYIEGSDNNDGFYELGFVNAGSMTIKDLNLTNETAGEYVTIYQVKFPPGLKMAIANLIRFQLSKKNTTDIKSESIGDYSVSYGASTDFPDHLLKSLKPYKRVTFV